MLASVGTWDTFQAEVVQLGLDGAIQNVLKNPRELFWERGTGQTEVNLCAMEKEICLSPHSREEEKVDIYFVRPSGDWRKTLK